MAGEQWAATALAPPDPAVPPPGEGYQGREGMAAYFVVVVFKMSAGSTFDLPGPLFPVGGVSCISLTLHLLGVAGLQQALCSRNTAYPRSSSSQFG